MCMCVPGEFVPNMLMANISLMANYCDLLIYSTLRNAAEEVKKLKKKKNNYKQLFFRRFLARTQSTTYQNLNKTNQHTYVHTGA